MLDILDRYCPLWSIALGTRQKCSKKCAWYEAWTNLDKDGAEEDGVCLLFNLRFLNWLRGEGE